MRGRDDVGKFNVQASPSGMFVERGWEAPELQSCFASSGMEESRRLQVDNRESGGVVDRSFDNTK